ncbi:hypothetical protein [Paraprevotella clara]|uniref:hypothetical protein n=1 Tax=Paraprevotella clara TaxID=454154 RepID=UPI00300EB645
MVFLHYQSLSACHGLDPLTAPIAWASSTILRLRTAGAQRFPVAGRTQHFCFWGADDFS